MPNHFVFVLVFLVGTAITLPIKDDPFRQASSTKFLFNTQQPLSDWRVLPFSSIADVIPSPISDQFLILTQNSIFLFNASTGVIQSLNVNVPPYSRVATNGGNQFVLAFANGFFRCSSFDAPQCVQYPFSFGVVNDVVLSSEGDIWIGSQYGLFFVPVGSKVPISVINETIVVIAYRPDDDSIAAGSLSRFWRKISNLGSSYWAFFWTDVNVITDVNYPVTAMDYDLEGNLWVATQVAINVQSNDLSMERIGTENGLPVSNVTNIRVSPEGNVWIGTMQGALQFITKTKSWKYYYGSRWLSYKTAQGNQIISNIAIGTSSDESALIVTSTGMSFIKYETWTLSKKASHYQSMISRHQRYGLVDNANLPNWGSLSNTSVQASDNQGLWTSIYLASQCFRYAVTKDPEVKKNAWDNFNGMRFLVNVTGIKGYPARALLPSSTLPNNNWHYSPTYPGWIFKGNTSSDEIVGHMFAYQIVYKLLAETPDEKRQVASLIGDIISGIIDNGYYLLGINRTRTQWGIWNPEQINNEVFWLEGKGVNSNQILSWLLMGYSITHNETYLTSFWDLCRNYGYNVNLINLKIEQPGDINFSDDELTYLPYFNYLFADNYYLKEYYQLSMDRTWQFTNRVQSPLWNTIYGVWRAKIDEKPNEPNGEDFQLDNALRCLKEFSLSLIDWPYNNTQRSDYKALVTRFGDPMTDFTLFPWDEITFSRWNANPFALSGGSGYQETDPGVWLLPYWMMRYYNYVGA